MWMIKRASRYAIDLGFGREGELTHGRISSDTTAGETWVSQGSRNAPSSRIAPMGVSSDWEAGKTIDSRQCLEAYRKRILVPEMKGGYISIDERLGHGETR